MDNTRLITLLISIIVLMGFYIFMQHEKETFRTRQLNEKEQVYLKKKGELKRVKDELDSSKSRYIYIVDSLFIEIEKRDQLAKQIKKNSSKTIKNLKDEKSNIPTWNHVERDTFWARESRRKEHIPNTKESNN